MFGRLAEAIEELDVSANGPALAEGFALLDRLSSKLCDAVGVFDAAQLWELDGATSMTAWLRGTARLSGKEAKHMTVTAKRLRSLPVTKGAWEEGSLSSGQVKAVMANVTDATLDALADHEADVVPKLAYLSVSDTATVMRYWAAAAKSLLEVPAKDEPKRSLSLSETLDGRHELTGFLDGEGGSVVSTALRLAEQPDLPEEHQRPAPERRADALVEVCRYFLDHQQKQTGGRHRPHLNVVVELEDLEHHRPGRLLDGAVLGPDTIERLLCDSALHRVVMSGRSSILDYGTATRTIPVNLWNALLVRDQHCRFPDCDRPAGWCDGHHVVSVLDGGATEPANLALQCRRHHTVLHMPGWHAKLLPDGTFEVTDPGGRVRTSRPPGRAP